MTAAPAHHTEPITEAKPARVDLKAIVADALRYGNRIESRYYRDCFAIDGCEVAIILCGDQNGFYVKGRAYGTVAWRAMHDGHSLAQLAADRMFDRQQTQQGAGTR